MNSFNFVDGIYVLHICEISYEYAQSVTSI